MTEPIVEPSIEQQVLISILSGRPDAVASTRSLLASGVDWDALLGLGREHNVIPLLFTWLRAHAQDLVPPDQFALLRGWYHVNTAQNIQLAHTLIEIMAALEAAGIAVVPLKGPLMALQAYGDLTLRQFSDLDLLIHPEDLPRAHQALELIGYQSLVGLSGERLSRIPPSLRPTTQVRRDGCKVEFHFGAVERVLVNTVPTTHWWETTETIELHGRQFRCLSRVNHMLVAAVHGSKHRWRMLKWIADLSALLDHATEGERLTLLQCAEGFGLLRMVSRAVELADALRNAPQQIQRHLSDSEGATPTRLEKALERAASLPDLSDELMEMRVFLMLKDRRHDLLQGYMNRVFVPCPEDLASVNLPPCLSSLYYPVRAGRLLGRALLKLPSLFVRRSR